MAPKLGTGAYEAGPAACSGARQGPEPVEAKGRSPMAGSVNKVILVGNLGRDPEVRRLTSGEPVVNLRIATSESWKDKESGERKEKTEWHSRRDLQREPGAASPSSI